MFERLLLLAVSVAAVSEVPLLKGMRHATRRGLNPLNPMDLIGYCEVSKILGVATSIGESNDLMSALFMSDTALDAICADPRCPGKLADILGAAEFGHSEQLVKRNSFELVTRHLCDKSSVTGSYCIPSIVRTLRENAALDPCDAVAISARQDFFCGTLFQIEPRCIGTATAPDPHSCAVLQFHDRGVLTRSGVRSSRTKPHTRFRLSWSILTVTT